MSSRLAASSGSDSRLAELDREAERLLSVGRADVAVLPERDELLSLDFTGHPWAQLVVAAALTDIRDERASAWLAASLAAFEADRDNRGIGFACFVTGHHELNHGRLIEAAEWYQRSRTELQDECPVDAAGLAHSGMGAYQQGELAQAIAITEEALALARVRGSRRYEGLACLYLAFYSLITGSFGRADNLLDVAEETYLEINDPLERYELPLVLGARGVLLALRGQSESSDEVFAAALDCANQVKEPWFVAIVQTLRAEFTARYQPTRAVADARQALEQLVALGDDMWGNWALRAQAVAAREVGDVSTSVHMLERLLEADPNQLERGLVLLALGESLVRTDQPERATEPLEEACRLLEPLGVRYWVARCWLALAEAGPPRAERRKRALALSDGDLAYQHLLSGDSQLIVRMLGASGIWQRQQRLSFPTRKAELAVFCLALAGSSGLHEEVLIERLWSDVPADRGRGRLRTLLWQVRQSLGREAWRLERTGPLVRLDLQGISLDLAELRITAVSLLRAAEPDLEVVRTVREELSQPLLSEWQYDQWVEVEAERNEQLVERLALWLDRP